MAVVTVWWRLLTSAAGKVIVPPIHRRLGEKGEAGLGLLGLSRGRRGFPTRRMTVVGNTESRADSASTAVGEEKASGPRAPWRPVSALSVGLATHRMVAAMTVQVDRRRTAAPGSARRPRPAAGP